MAKAITWDGQATDDMHQIYQYYLDRSEKYADALMEAIFTGVGLVERFPFLGKVVPELNVKTVRELVIQRYRIISFVSEQPEIRILAVRHGSRPLENFTL